MLEGAKSIGAGAATIASAGAAVGIGNVFSSLIHSVARKGNPISVRLGKNRSSDSNRFGVAAFATHYLLVFVVPKLGPLLYLMSICQFFWGVRWGLLGNEIFHFGVGPDGVAPPALDLNERPPLHLLYADVESSDSQQARNYEILAHLRRVQEITLDLQGERNIARRQALIDIMDLEIRSLQRHFQVFRYLDHLRDSQRARAREILDLFR